MPSKFGALIVLFTLVLIVPTHGPAEEGIVFPYSARVEKENINVRAGQSVNFERVGQVTLGEVVVVLEEAFGWTRIKLPVQCESYIHSDFVTDFGQGIGRVTGERVNVRSRAQLNSSILGQASKGDMVKLLEKKEDWYRIEPLDQCSGWVSSEFLAFHSPQVPPPRRVELPVKNSDRKRALSAVLQVQPAPEAPPPAPAPQTQTVEVTGTITELGGRSISRDIRHKLVVDEKTAYFLQGYRLIVDGFKNQKVLIEGEIKTDIKAEHPVVMVKKIKLIL